MTYLQMHKYNRAKQIKNYRIVYLSTPVQALITDSYPHQEPQPSTTVSPAGSILSTLSTHFHANNSNN